MKKHIPLFLVAIIVIIIRQLLRRTLVPKYLHWAFIASYYQPLFSSSNQHIVIQQLLYAFQFGMPKPIPTTPVLLIHF